MPKHEVKVRYAKRLKAFGLHLKKLRTAKGLTQEGVAHEAGMSYNSINTIENGKLNPTLATLMAIADALKIELTDLLDY